MKHEGIIFSGVRRLAFVPISQVAPEFRRVASILESTRCHWSLFGSDSKSTSSDNRVGAEGEAQIAQGASVTGQDEAASAAGQGVVSKDDGVSLGGNASKNTVGSDLSGGQAVQNEAGVTLAGYANKNLLGGVEVGGSNSGTINIGDTKGIEAIADKFATTVESISRPVAASGNSNVNPGAVKDDEKPRDRATDGNNFIWWAVGILASIVLYVAFRPKLKAT